MKDTLEFVVDVKDLQSKIDNIHGVLDLKTRETIAFECMKIMIRTPPIMNQSFEVIADFAFRQADAFLAKAKEPQI